MSDNTRNVLLTAIAALFITTMLFLGKEEYATVAFFALIAAVMML